MSKIIYAVKRKNKPISSQIYIDFEWNGIERKSRKLRLAFVIANRRTKGLDLFVRNWVQHLASITRFFSYPSTVLVFIFVEPEVNVIHIVFNRWESLA